jgi:polyhydroxybutyrate depolymerase
MHQMIGHRSLLRAAHPSLLASVAVAAAALGTSGATAVKIADREGCGTAQRGLSEGKMESAGVGRGYVLFVPEACPPGGTWPVVIDLHGSGSHPREQLSITGMAAEATRRGLVVLLPVAAVPIPGGGTTWNIPPDPTRPDDVQYVADALEDAALRVPLDRSRVYVSGFSGGARLASAIASAHPERIAAAGAVGGLRAPDGPGAPVPIVAWHGTADPINPYDGGGPAYWGTGVEGAARAWAMRNGCRSLAPAHHTGSAVRRLEYRDCAGTSAVILHRLEETGHVWPGSAFPFPPARFGSAAPGVEATRDLLDFFERYRNHPAREHGRSPVRHDVRP